jgi:hypothetical protein
METNSSTIFVGRFHRIDEPLDLAPLFAARPQAHPERIVRTHGEQATPVRAAVSVRYENGLNVYAPVRVDEYGDRDVELSVVAPGQMDATPATPYPDVSRAALVLLLGDIGHAVLDPSYPDGEGGCPY